MEVKHIVLYNHYHIGDVYLSYGLVKQIVKSNPGIRCTYVINKGDALFANITSLEIQHFDEFEKHYKLFMNVPYMKLDEHTIAINLWIGQLWISGQHFSIECVFTRMQESLFTQIHRINLNYKTSIKYEPGDWVDLIPVLPTCDISAFESWCLRQHGCGVRHIIMYYNYIPRSLQNIGVRNHSMLIAELAAAFPTSAILVAKATPALLAAKPPNVFDCATEFDCEERDDCFNLIKLARMAELCTYVVTFDIGSTFLYLNSRLFAGSHKVIVGSLEHKYYSRLRENIHVSDAMYLQKVVPITSGEGFTDRLVEYIRSGIPHKLEELYLTLKDDSS